MTSHFRRKSQGARRNGAIPASISADVAKDATQGDKGSGPLLEGSESLLDRKDLRRHGWRSGKAEW